MDSSDGRSDCRWVAEGLGGGVGLWVVAGVGGVLGVGRVLGGQEGGVGQQGQKHDEGGHGGKMAGTLGMIGTKCSTYCQVWMLRALCAHTGMLG